MLHPGHPLTARVIVNRLWQGHFGAGLVRSASNFGARGEPPSHPELLDWLARELVRGGWSLKRLHRLICSSSTYQSACIDDPAARAVDPENRLLWSRDRLRLDAESIRDALLATSGMLDRTLGGSLLSTNNGDYVTNDQSNDQARYESPRRSLYLPIIRNAMFDLFTAFDYPDPSVTVDERPRTTTPTQALFLMNSPLAMSTSRTLAASCIAAASEDRERVDWLYRRILARRPSNAEQSLALAFVARLAHSPRADAPVEAGASAAPAAPPSDPQAAAEPWRALAQVLLASNEFLHVE
jgi:hypothetical protein